MFHRSVLALPAALLLGVAACSSNDAGTPLRDPTLVARPTEAELSRRAGDPADGAGTAESAFAARSTSRPLAYVNGEVITYREVLLRVGPQLAALRSESERMALEEQTLQQIVRSRLIYQAARDVSVTVRPSEVEEQIQSNVRDLERSGATLEAYLLERGMTRREYEETIRRELVTQIYMYAAIGRGGTPRVRPRADTYVSPAEVRKYYERNPDLFREPATAQVRMLKVKPDFMADDRAKAVREARKRCVTARERLAGGEDWVPVFRSFNTGDAAAAPLDGLLTVRQGEGAYADWIEEFAFTQEKGGLSDVLQQGSTFMLLYSEGSTEARLAPYSEVQDDVRQRLSHVKRVLASYEVELQLLQAGSVQPERVRSRLRDKIRRERRKLL